MSPQFKLETNIKYIYFLLLISDTLKNKIEIYIKDKKLTYIIIFN